MVALADRVMVITTSTGTGAVVLGLPVTGYQNFNVIGDGNTVDYTIEAVDSNGNPTGDWEVGQGVFTLAPPSLSRNTVYSSSNLNSLVNFSTGTKRVFVTVPAALISTFGTGQVVSVNGKIGAVVLAASDVGAPSGSGTSTGTNTGDQTITLTGSVTGSGTGSFATTIANGVVTEAMQNLSDNTTANVSTSKHGYAPKSPGNAGVYLDGTGSYSVPGGASLAPGLLVPVLTGGVTDADHPNNFSHGQFWPNDSIVSLGTTMRWEAWVKPTHTGYVISDGYGGGHSLLWGFTGIDPGPFTITGNIWLSVGPGPQSFNGNYQVNNGEWVHICVYWNGSVCYSFINGICDGASAMTGTRQTANSPSTGYLFVGGSDHLNFGGSIAMIRGYDRGQVLTSVVNGVGFIPPRVATVDWPLGIRADFLCNYTTPGVSIPDLSSGVQSTTGGPPVVHPATMWSGNSGYQSLEGDGQYFGPFPTWVVDTGCPYGQILGSPLPNENIPSPGTPPAGAVVFDSFGRRNQTWAFQGPPSLGMTEAGSAGIQTWQQGMTNGGTPLHHGSYGLGMWGILGGWASFLDSGDAIAWVPTGITDMDVQVKYKPVATASGINAGGTGIAFRVIDKDNWWCAVKNAKDNNITICKTVSGTTSFVAQHTGQTIASNPYLRAVAHGTTITVYDSPNGSTWTQQIQLTGQTDNQTGQGAGLASSFVPTLYLDSASRYGNFTVFAG